MTGLPTLQVQLDDGTGTFPFDITSKCLLEPGFSFTRGRDDWQGGVEAASISLTLNNSDGRFTPGSTLIGSPTPIKVDQRIRIRETINGITFNRFTGYVKSWPVAWPATVPTFSTVKITVSDAQARAERQDLRSVIEQEILATVPAPTLYYTLGEPAGSTSAGDSSGGQGPVLKSVGSGAAVVFGGAGPLGGGSSTVATFAGGQYLATGPFTYVPGGGFTTTVNFWFSTTTNDAVSRTLVSTQTGGDITLLNGRIEPAGTVVADGLWHHISWQGAGGAGGVMLDGVATGITVGALILSLTVGQNFIGSIAHLAAFPTTTVPGGWFAAQYQAGATGFAGESGTARLTRTAGYANLSVGTLDTSLTNVAYTDITGQSDWTMLQQVADAEGGVVFVDGSGNLIFHNRTRPTAKTAPDLTLPAAYVTPDVQPVTDDQQILNYLAASSETTGVTQVVQNAASITSHGKYPSEAAFLVQTDQEALDRANWLVTNYAEPTTRYGTLTINLYGMSAALAQSVLSAIEVNCWLRITGAPSQTPGSTTIDVVVEGYTEELTADSWTLSCNVVSRSLFTAFILDDATFGVLDSSRLYF